MDAELETFGTISTILKWKTQFSEISREIQKQEEQLIKQTVSTKEYCSKLGISRTTLYRRIELGRVTPINIGGKNRYVLPEKGECNG